ncbi:EamA family transporter RarD [Bacteroidetes bacterium endosymbiont of Geopemphigus sp.]|uniref:EamA family transporter RarD n=1 Tax=Bacteroidetes bacterium endosymbiont of Geopemphigus sp. TaxID=2047937 RepID=UPI000CD05BBC|nr:EamA family transporter RarD [Bacteroidetes bacterium endosymbiont of Geopemphigus sp.]
MHNLKLRDLKKGVLLGVIANLIWSFSTLLYKQLSEINAYHVVSWRIISSEVLLLLIIIITNRIKTIYDSLKRVSFVNVSLISLLFAIWWLVHIYGVLSGKLLEVSFGYFISPLMSMLASGIIFKEKLSNRQKVAISVATFGVALQSLNFESVPWIAIIIGACYSIYGILKKKNTGDAIVMQALEISFLLPFALTFLILSPGENVGHVFFESTKKDIFLISTGLVTVLPLWCYSIAAKKLPMIWLGFIQFIPPICNFLLAVFIYSEPVTTIKMISFVLIWISLITIFLPLGRSKVSVS